MTLDEFATARAQVDAYIVDCTCALHCNGKRVGPWVRYRDGVIELPARIRDYWFNELRFTDPATHEVRMIVRTRVYQRVRRREPQRRRVVIQDVFGAEIEKYLVEAARRRVAG